MGKRNHVKGELPYQFWPLPKDVIRSPAWSGLSDSAIRLAIDLMSQYTGSNNGRLCPAWKAMQAQGWKSKETLQNAKRALLDCPFVVLTRKGHPPKTAEWIGFTWWQLDFERSMDVDPKLFPYLNFIEFKRIDPNAGRQEKLISDPRNPYRLEPKTASSPPKSVPMECAA